jgi:AraC-like DNA-binding protein
LPKYLFMEDFKIILPSSMLSPYVKHYWILKTIGNSTSIARTVPTGMMSLIFHRGNCLLSINENKIQPRAFLSGQEKTFNDLRYYGYINMISIVFRPVGVRAFFNLPIDRTAGLRLTAGDMEDKELSELERTLTSTEEDKLCILLIEHFLLKRLTQLAEYNIKRIDTAIGLINAGQTDIVKLADATCLSTKQFNRIFSENIGTSPKEYSRIIRFQRALNLLEKDIDISFTALACDCGYFDQSHMIKDFKTFSGYTPSEYIAECPPHSDYFEK